jgi:transcriptional regulator with XRE-family HTH domain
MNPTQQLSIIHQLTGGSQTETARRLSVSFVTFNRWINGRATPRKKTRVRIAALYRGCTGLTEIPAEALAANKTSWR